MRAFLERCASGRGPFLCLFVLALALRLGNAGYGSLKLDDFHSLHHARAPDVQAFFGGLLRDNHPPLSFLLVSASRAAFGEGTWALRLPSLLAGLGTLALLWRLGARLACPLGRIAAALFLAASTLHVDLSSDVRMYALLALASAGLLEALLSRLDDGRGAWRVALWTFVGLHTHYHFLYTLLVLGATLAWLGLTRPDVRPALRACLGAFAVAALLSAPWYVLGFPAQLAHGLAPGGSNATFARLLEGLKNLVFLNISVAGRGLRGVGLVASTLLVALAALGAVTLARRVRAGDRSAAPWLLTSSALLVPALAWAAAELTARAGFEWRYLTGALPAFCLVVGAEACASGPLARLRRAAVLALGPCVLAVALANVRDPGEEDYRGAIGWIVAQASSADAVVAADWQPRIFPHGLAWEYYAPRLAGERPLPRRLEFTDEFALADPTQLAGHERVFCCLRSLKNESPLLVTLRKRYGSEHLLVFGRSVFVHVFTRPEDGIR